MAIRRKLRVEKTKNFPDGTRISDWFFDYTLPKKEDYKNKFVITDYGILSDGKIYTEKLQKLIMHYVLVLLCIIKG